jgi:SAM-dependent methyltransferase
MNEFDAFARYYDADIGSHIDDLAFYRQLAQRTGGPIVELMCGTGRVLLPLARAGFQITGVDVSPLLLAQARRKLEAAGLLDQVALQLADLRQWHSESIYRLAIIALNSFMHFSDPADHLAALASIHRALRSDGLLVIDLFNPDLREIVQQNGQIFLDKTFVTSDGTQVQKSVVQVADPATQISQVTFLYDELDAEGRLRRTTLPFTMRWFYRYELEHLLARAGFVIEMIYGSYDLDDYQSDSPQLLVIARKH